MGRNASSKQISLAAVCQTLINSRQADLFGLLVLKLLFASLDIYIQPLPHHHHKTIRGVYPTPAVSQRPILAHQADRQ